jgi:hypothetical protein
LRSSENEVASYERNESVYKPKEKKGMNSSLFINRKKA